MHKTIRIAGNTECPCYWAIIKKGFEVTISSQLTNVEGSDCRWTYEAQKDDWLFSATTIQALLGLITMWEIRSDDWRASENEKNTYIEYRGQTPFYDIEGNEIFDE
ncbi:hypothetical protein [Isobaculum melis]|uniref:Uncharacterized protein n=1 Tax=Isobaculum melis TaxID=142588 RepID=A0A1H9RW99_9LACT|nr:hypothetical protein [Isobaculum melis]SER76868.1 hypothetical protein SAMN04488559_105124 [Isobaculum melis]